MNYKDWLILRSISEAGNLSRASKKIYLTQPAVTKRIQQMEKELGVNIIYRTNRGALLTPQGEFLADKALKIITDVENIENDLQKMKDALSGSIKISAANFMMRYRLPKALSDFKRMYPRVDFKIEVGWSRDMLKKLQNNEVDIAFVRGDYAWREGKQLLFLEPMCVASIEPLELADLPGRKRIDYRTDDKLRELIDRWWMQNYRELPNISIEVSRTDICKELIKSGLGYAILPKYSVADVPDIHTYDLMDEHGKVIVRPTWMFYSHQTEEVALLKRFIKHFDEIDF
ncbi:LysR family transcriptional regulator [Salinicoccus sp. ID82-1]|uniref:LysR family transcriptional regulator n=1 Tax=Salinicoccus sp. ID82-1 TaxID=2820269 RepID=UPI001F15F1FE|nr:LysR family transcriptional regulator [Salinicoccus sp. ID82-1]MCG1009650.1 LysR family transcriptional regulator [Salinicoccus sp. ID82-1]